MNLTENIGKKIEIIMTELKELNERIITSANSQLGKWQKDKTIFNITERLRNEGIYFDFTVHAKVEMLMTGKYESKINKPDQRFKKNKI